MYKLQGLDSDSTAFLSGTGNPLKISKINSLSNNLRPVHAMVDKYQNQAQYDEEQRVAHDP